MSARIFLHNNIPLPDRYFPQSHPASCKKLAKLQHRQLSATNPAREFGVEDRMGLGKSNVQVSPLCLGTMQYGEAIDYNQAAEQMSTASELGINFIDTAEMYPVPQREATQGASEEFVGRWLRGRNRNNYVITTKATGPSGQMTYIRGGPLSLDRSNILEAIDGSLTRLQTDHIDLYMLHWPDRYVPMFGENEYDPLQSYASTSIDEQVQALQDAQTAGKIREFGVSNETAWGLTRFAQAAERGSRKQVAALQNAYSLLCRTFDSSLAECCHQEAISLVAYSPLAMGLLTGKYREGIDIDPRARLNKYRGRYAEAESRYGPKPNVCAAVEGYCDIAQQAGMEPYELAIRFTLGRPLIASTIIGATSVTQLKQLAIAAGKGPLPNDIQSAIDAMHQRYPNPCP